jgi:uncharacterized protein
LNTLWFVTARTCNLACGYCYQGADNHEAEYLKPRGLQAIMSKDVADKALPWAVDWAPEHGIKVVFYGGEPTLAWPLIEAVVPEWREAFKKAGKPIRFSVTTNGTMLTPDRRAWMDANDVGLMVSLDGPKEAQDQSRPAKTGNGSSWDLIKPQDLLEWHPDLEVAWCLAPGGPWSPGGLSRLLEMGFRRINFNLADADWSAEDQVRLQAMGQLVGRLCATGALLSNWWGKFEKAGTATRMERPCGTNVHGMLALTPEGDLFPSQEMAFTVYEDGKPPETPRWYKVGNVAQDPVLDPVAAARISILRTKDMTAPEGYDCADCAANAICIGGCHCRHVGQNDDPGHRTDVPRGVCQSNRAFLSGIMMGAWVERKLRPASFYKREVRPQAACPAPEKPAAPEFEFPDVANLSFGGRHGV